MVTIHDLLCYEYYMLYYMHKVFTLMITLTGKFDDKPTHGQ